MAFRQSALSRAFLSPYLLGILAILAWASTFVVVRGVHEVAPPIGLNFGRTALALAMFLIIGYGHVRREWDGIVEHWKQLCIIGFLLIVTGNTVMFVGLQYTTAINMALLNSMMPIVIVCFSWVLLRDRLTLLQSFGIVISLLGVITLIARAKLSVLAGLDFNRGDLLMLMTVLSWALYAVLIKRWPMTLHPVSFMSGVTFCGLVILLPFYLWEALFIKPTVINPAMVASGLYLGPLGSAIAILWYNRAIRELGANRVGIFSHLSPAFTVILAFIFLGEVLHLFHIAGIALIAVGIYLTTVLGSRQSVTGKASE